MAFLYGQQGFWRFHQTPTSSPIGWKDLLIVRQRANDQHIANFF
jgi:hypothetical protein